MLSVTGGPAKRKRINGLICKLFYSKNAVGEILSVCFCKIKCLDLWNAKMQGRRENEICKYKLFSKAFC